MSDSTVRPEIAILARFLVGLVLATAAGWTVLVLGGRTDAAGRMGIALGAAVLPLMSFGWGRGRRGWLLGLAVAALLAGAMLAHFWIRLGRLP